MSIWAFFVGFINYGGSGPTKITEMVWVVKTKFESFLRCMSLIMPLSFASDDKPRRAYKGGAIRLVQKDKSKLEEFL
ncbi:MAG: hypothetical protein DRJ06_04960 [Candidatus Aminicenantes bacterium]|nr:MAG: hypothetical protein DRJ06_04960 [Candidatus Aminicenantes bacterium]